MATLSSSSAVSRASPFSPKSRRLRLSKRRPTTARPSRLVPCALWNDGRTVDEHMVVLRRRLHEARKAETNYEPPAGWMEWERRYYHKYDSDVCHAVGVLQTVLLNTRPSVALGALVLVAASLPVSACVALQGLLKAPEALLSLVLQIVMQR